MKAVICPNYGLPEVLQIQEVLNDNQILVKIIATAINSGDVRVRSLNIKGFMKLIMRFISPASVANRMTNHKQTNYRTDRRDI